MKLAYLCALPLAFSFCFIVPAVHADDDAKVEVKEKNGKHEFKMKVTRHGDHYVGFYNNHEYILRGDAVAHINTDGDYVVYGDISPDNTYIETTQLQPVVVERRAEPAVRDREVIIEKHDDPMIKVGPLKIGN